MKKMTTTMLLSIACVSGFAQSTWIDVTDSYVINPRFDNNDRSTGWSGSAFTAANPKENAEFYSRNYDAYQTITGLPVGKYRVSLDAFYRMGSSYNDYSLYKSGNYSSSQNAKLYATSSIGDYEVSIVPASSAALSESLGGAAAGVGGNGGWGGGWGNRDTYYIPNNMEAAYYWFEAGYYDNFVECQVGADGKLTIGVRKNTLINEDWTCLDNWKLEFYGELVNATSVTLSKSEVEAICSEQFSLTATVLPSNATYRQVNWSSSDESIATVDSKGNVTAIANGTCYIIATSKDGKASAKCKVTVSSGQATAENIVINEIMASNVDVYMDPSYNYGSWVELYNPTDQTVALGGLYVTDNANNLKKHRLIDSYGVLPAHGYAILNFDHHEVWTMPSYRQIDDDLDCEGGTIIISDGEKILARQDYPQAISRTSYARTTDGGSEWGVTGNPSPGTANQENGGFATVQLEAPTVDKDAQVFSGSMQVCVNIPEGATLKYTTDGTAPTLTNGEVSKTGLFTVDESTCYRFRLFQDGYLPSQVVTRSYIYDNGNYHFPIISVVTDKNNIYSKEYGVFQRSDNGRPGNGQSTACNWNMDWDRPVAFEYITADNKCLISQECNFAMCGGWSRAWEPHSFKLKAKKVFDFNNFFSAPLFENKPYIKNKTLQIRNGGNDYGCRIKDPALQQVVAKSGLKVDYQEWQPVHVFLNGEHYAVLNMREPNNKHFAYSNYGIDTDFMDQFEMSPDSGYVQMAGTEESFTRLVNLSENAADEATYAEICKLLDIDEYANYMAVEFYLGGTDWPQNNVKGFRDSNDGKFHFVLFDLDGAGSTTSPFNAFFGKEHYTFDKLYGYDYSKNESLENKHNTRDIKFVTLFRNLLNNETFRKKFIDTYCIVGGSVFQPKYVKSIIGEAADKLATGSYVNPYNTSNNLISKFGATSYNSTMVNQLKNCSNMQLSGETYQQASIGTNVAAAKVELNGMELPYSEFNGYLFAPVTLKAVAPAGYKFAGWASDTQTSATSIFDAGSSWSYYDGGSLDGKQWKATSYDTQDWKTGAAPIGYGKNEATETESNLSCYYFRKSFRLASEPSAEEVYKLNFTVDDGAIVYVNGKEVGRYNMPNGEVAYDDFASSYAPNNPDTGTMTIDASLFQKGNNTIAVEVHNNALNSSDILWDASLTVSKNSANGNYVSTETEYEMPSNGSQTLTAVFEKLADGDLKAEGITPVRVNEVSAANSMFINDYFKKNDWIELYNTTDEDIDIAGMYISDNLKKPEKYQVPTEDVRLNTIIPAHSYKVVWCDKLDNKGGDIHTTFKLAADGGDVLIKTNEYADTLTYTAHAGNQSFGRYPDGANQTYLMNVPTIGKANQLSSYDSLYVVPGDSDNPSSIVTSRQENGVSMAYVDGVVNVKSEDAAIMKVMVYGMAGMRMNADMALRSGGHFATVNVGTLPQGIYVVRVVTEEEECSLKLYVK